MIFVIFPHWWALVGAFFTYVTLRSDRDVRSIVCETNTSLFLKNFLVSGLMNIKLRLGKLHTHIIVSLE